MRRTRGTGRKVVRMELYMIRRSLSVLINVYIESRHIPNQMIPNEEMLETIDHSGVPLLTPPLVALSRYIYYFLLASRFKDMCIGYEKVPALLCVCTCRFPQCGSTEKPFVVFPDRAISRSVEPGERLFTRTSDACW